MRKERTKNIFAVYLKPEHFQRLDQVAKETDRSKGAVIRRLIEMTDLPEARRLIGFTTSEVMNAEMEK